MEGRVTLVTGASGGIGSEVVRTLIAAGGTVIATDLGAENPFAGEPRVHYARYDVTSREQTDQLVERVLREHGKIDALVLCAGSIANTPIDTSTDEEWESIWRM
jgi:NAD(P)-dependent dehydrogenase (short-subunit alcohol dehydrogenase family)